MAVQYVDLDALYNLDNNNDDVEVKVIVGDGQPNYSINVFLDQSLLGSGPNINLGPASELRGKRLMIVVVVQDRLEVTNWTSFTAWIRQGRKETQYGPYSKEAENHMDTVIYTLKIQLQ
jgi:hypothetical protein